VERKHGRNITPEYLADMQYADATIKEVLRLAVIISTVPKRALTTFELCGYTIPEVNTSQSAPCIVSNNQAVPMYMVYAAN
jgi:hypothetical protein